MLKTANTGNEKRKKIKESNITDVVDGLYIDYSKFNANEIKWIYIFCLPSNYHEKLKIFIKGLKENLSDFPLFKKKKRR